MNIVGYTERLPAQSFTSRKVPRARHLSLIDDDKQRQTTKDHSRSNSGSSRTIPLENNTRSNETMTTSTEPQHTPPSPFHPSSLTLLTQGAEALVYRTTFLTQDTQCALKYRPSKPYRHPTLDKRLTRQRILAEARVLVRCKKDNLAVPGVLGLDVDAGWIALEWVTGDVIRVVLQSWRKENPTYDAAQDGNIKSLMRRIGATVGEMHKAGVVHGDLTTSNLILRPRNETEQGTDGEVVLIDFGLAMQNIQDEDKAVDLYVLERAFGSTHPWAEEAFAEVLGSYGESYKGAKVVLKRLEDVRMRGRKKSMLG